MQSASAKATAIKRELGLACLAVLVGLPLYQFARHNQKSSVAEVPTAKATAQ
ncbi:MAG: hypothetical protein WBR10_11910 [Candidatus Acidiferrum sp.]